MFKNLRSMEKCMVKVLKSIQSTDNYDKVINSFNRNEYNVLHICNEKHYIANLSDFKTEGGTYVFRTTDNVYITPEGLQFIKDTSALHRLWLAVRDVLKGTLGFWIGVASTIVSDAVIRILFSPNGILGFMENFLQ